MPSSNFLKTLKLEQGRKTLAFKEVTYICLYHAYLGFELRLVVRERKLFRALVTLLFKTCPKNVNFIPLIYQNDTILLDLIPMVIFPFICGTNSVKINLITQFFPQTAS